MKYLITPSQIDRIVFKYLDNQDFIQIEENNRIYFVNSVGDNYGQIISDKNERWCGIYHELVKEISSFFSMKSNDSIDVIKRWVENKLQMELTGAFYHQMKVSPLTSN